MATKKKPVKKSKKPVKVAGRKKKPTKKSAQKVKPPAKSAKQTAQKSAVKTRPAKQANKAKTASASARQGQKKRPARAASAFSRGLSGPGSAGQSGDLQGLSELERADSESVDELIEEGNAFEAGVVAGVEEAGERGDREVHTREVLEDDVPDEYLDQD
jgi:hypothetical protein